jgi:hypothetical protein
MLEKVNIGYYKILGFISHISTLSLIQITIIFKYNSTALQSSSTFNHNAIKQSTKVTVSVQVKQQSYKLGSIGILKITIIHRIYQTLILRNKREFKITVISHCTH